jgi:hypothetical protein
MKGNTMTAIDYTGQQFGRLTVLGDALKVGAHRKLNCQCTCGVIKSMYLSVIKAGAQSCGCLQREIATKHGQSRSGNPLYGVWTNMKSRCTDINAKYYPEYGGRGITVCEQWATSFETFELWANNSGYIQGLTLDRANNDSNYQPDNCRWVNRTAQQRNRRGQKDSSSQYVGVSFIQRNQKWMAGIKIDGKPKNLGLYQTELQAAIARDTYIVENNLENFTLNNVL